MKICLVSPSPDTYGVLTGDPKAQVGGAELQLKLISTYLQEHGTEVSFLVHDLDQSDISTNDRGVRLIKTFGLKKSGLLLRYIKPLRLFRGMNLANADVYYQRCCTPITGLIAIWCRLKRRKFIFAVASDWDVDGTRERAMNAINRILYRFGVSRANIILVQTEQQHKMLKKRFGKDGITIRNIYPVLPREDINRKHVLWVANFHALKRPEMLLEIAKRLPSYKFVMVGGPAVSEPAVFDDIKDEASRIPNVEFLGQLPYDQVGELYAQASALVNTSIIEGFPNTYLDAMSRQVPIVATFDPDEIICKHDLGFHCDTVDDLAVNVERILIDDELRRRLGDNAYNYVLNNHDECVVGTAYEDILQRLLKN